MMNLTGNKFLHPHIKASAKGRDVLILSHREHPIVRCDGRRVAYEIEHRWLSMDPTPEGDEVCCVKGADWTYWSKRELTETGALNPHSSLFDSFLVC